MRGRGDERKRGRDDGMKIVTSSVRDTQVQIRLYVSVDGLNILIPALIALAMASILGTPISRRFSSIYNDVDTFSEARGTRDQIHCGSEISHGLNFFEFSLHLAQHVQAHSTPAIFRWNLKQR